MILRPLDNFLGRFSKFGSLIRNYAADTKATSVAPTPVKDKTSKALAKKDDVPRDERGIPTVPMGLMKQDDPMIRGGYGVGRTAVRLDWWNNNNRWHYWASWAMLRDVTRRKWVCEHAPYRLRMNALMDNNILPVGFRESVLSELDKMPYRYRWESTRSFCQITGRRRGRVLRYRVSRIVFRDMADHGKLCGVTRSNF